MREVKFRQIVTGTYSYEEKDEPSVEKISHCLYGLDSNGEVWKLVKNDNWLKLSERKH